QTAFMGDSFRVYTSDDVTGVELGGTLKNIIAVAAGILDGMGLGDNSKAALMTRGLAEISRLGAALGAQPETFSGLSGIGDLIVTCASRHSRNRAVGERLGKGESLQDIMGGMKQVAEGIWNAKAARDLARKLNIDMPITEEVCAIVEEGKDPRQALADLMNREPKAEVRL
ncbi:MAG TPA: NAD(P)H-dependent glycerol-3-phosphate dehydrogenase, partial [Tichowtungia sp.]|nr:NAD(P)H-dependent glycerol-3-phosphate dehydrogenase [Tichowtungia sp.]